MEMNVPTVYLLGEDHLELIPEYLQLGSVVVVAPDRDILRRWTDDQQDDGADASVEHTELNGLVVDLSARRVAGGVNGGHVCAGPPRRLSTP